ncbi:MAG: efflux transporter outer membrane subunit [Alphaproteobacteria bacterium]
MRNLTLLLAASMALAGCSSWLAPRFQLPNMFAKPVTLQAETPLPFTSPTVVGSWQMVSVSATLAPLDASGTTWVQHYPLPKLAELTAKAHIQNPTLQAQAARVEQARALAGLAFAAQLPTLTASADATRYRSAPSVSSNTKARNTFGADVFASFELDLFGRVAGTARAATLQALAAEDLQADVALALDAEIARTYTALLAATVVERSWSTILAAQEQQLAILTARYDAGELDVSNWQAAAATLQQQRSLALGAASYTRQLHHALALLLGEAPQVFDISEKDLASLSSAAPMPVGNMSATIALQRPDVRAAALALEAANQRIGVARAAFLPRISFNALGGFVNPVWGDVFDWDNRTWSMGPALTLPLFQAGANRANLRRNWAVYEESVAIYKGQVLGAFADIANSLITLQISQNQAASAQQAVAAITRSFAATSARFAVGDVGKFEQLGADIALAQAHLNAAQAQAGWHTQAFRFIQATGGKMPHAAPSLTPTPAP